MDVARGECDIADDETLLNYAKRIQGRAVRRMGELLKTLDARGDHRKTEGDHSSSISQREAANAAGLSPHQQVQAVRVANVPEADFEAAIESEKSPTITALAAAPNSSGSDQQTTSARQRHARSRYL